MPRIQHDRLRNIGYELFETFGCRPEDARTVVDHLVDSNLYGHPSHGVMRYYEYGQAIREGRFGVRSTPKIVQETPSTAVVDGGGAWGQIGATFATRVLIGKAKQYGVAAVTLRNTCHIGRVGAYPLMMAQEDMIGQAFVNGGRLGYQVAPFGGRDGRLTTNPLSFAAPRRVEDPILLDMATCTTAEGKIRVYINRDDPVPEGWIIDEEGDPTTDPNRYKSDPGGAILPLGGVAGHKGYGLSFMMEILGGALSGQGCAAGEQKLISNGVLLTAFRIEHFTDLESYYEEVESLIRHVRSSRLAAGFREILLPGEPEFRGARRRRREGIRMDERTWTLICEECRSHGVDPQRWLAA